MIDPTVRLDPLAYPFAPALEPFVTDGRRFGWIDDLDADPRLVRATIDGHRATLADHFPEAVHWLAPERLIPTVAVGSNGSPLQLRRKFGRRATPLPILSIPGAWQDVASVFAAHVAGYGSIAATLAHVPGARTTLPLVHLPEPLMMAMDASEGLGTYYNRYFVDDACLTTRDSHVGSRRVIAYVALRGALAFDGRRQALDSFPLTGGDLTALSQRAVWQRLARALGDQAADAGDRLRGRIGRDLTTDALEAEISARGLSSGLDATLSRTLDDHPFVDPDPAPLSL